MLANWALSLQVIQVILAASLGILPFYRGDKAKFLIAKWLLVLNVVISVTNAALLWRIGIEQSALDLRNHSTIRWDRSLAQVELVGLGRIINPTDFNVDVKIIPISLPEIANLPSGNSLKEDLRAGCEPGGRSISAESARALFFLFLEDDGTIDLSAEKKSGIEHLYYVGKAIQREDDAMSSLEMHLQRSPDVSTPVRALADLNENVVVAQLRASDPESISYMGGLTISLDSAMGPHRLSVDSAPHTPTRDKDSTPLIIGTSRFVGACVTDISFH